MADETVAAFTALVRGLAPLAGTQIDICNHLIYFYIKFFFQHKVEYVSKINPDNRETPSDKSGQTEKKTKNNHFVRPVICTLEGEECFSLPFAHFLGFDLSILYSATNNDLAKRSIEVLKKRYYWNKKDPSFFQINIYSQTENPIKSVDSLFVPVPPFLYLLNEKSRVVSKLGHSDHPNKDISETERLFRLSLVHCCSPVPLGINLSLNPYVQAGLTLDLEVFPHFSVKRSGHEGPGYGLWYFGPDLDAGNISSCKLVLHFFFSTYDLNL